jgi:hypothetical protein
MEDAMREPKYRVVKEIDRWTIIVGGRRIISCRDRRTAMRTARQAAELLKRFETTQAAAEASPTEACDAHVLPGASLTWPASEKARSERAPI